MTNTLCARSHNKSLTLYTLFLSVHNKVVVIQWLWCRDKSCALATLKCYVFQPQYLVTIINVFLVINYICSCNIGFPNIGKFPTIQRVKRIIISLHQTHWRCFEQITNTISHVISIPTCKHLQRWPNNYPMHLANNNEYLINVETTRSMDHRYYSFHPKLCLTHHRT